MMDRRVAERCVQLMQSVPGGVITVDITGGAPELNSQFRCGCQIGIKCPVFCLPNRAGSILLAQPGPQSICAS
jgi:hypothetical protein